MIRNILYYYCWPAEHNLPYLYRVLFNRVIKSQHVEGLKIWSTEIGFENGMKTLKWSTKQRPSFYNYTPDKIRPWEFWKFGGLRSITLRLGHAIVTICLTKKEAKRHIESIERYAMPGDFYTVTKVTQCNETRYKLFFRYDFDRYHTPVKLNEPLFIQTYEQPPTRKEIYREIMLNDSYRWRESNLDEGEAMEISERAYRFLKNCMPPRNEVFHYFQVGEMNHHDSKGVAIYRACNYVDGKYYTGHPRTIYDLKPAP